MRAARRPCTTIPTGCQTPQAFLCQHSVYVSAFFQRRRRRLSKPAADEIIQPPWFSVPLYSSSQRRVRSHNCTEIKPGFNAFDFLGGYEVHLCYSHIAANKIKNLFLHFAPPPAAHCSPARRYSPCRRAAMPAKYAGGYRHHHLQNTAILLYLHIQGNPAA